MLLGKGLCMVPPLSPPLKEEVWEICMIQVIQVVFLLTSNFLSLCKLFSLLFIGPCCHTWSQPNTQTPAAESHLQLHCLRFLGHGLSNLSHSLTLTCLLSAPSAQTPPQAFQLPSLYNDRHVPLMLCPRTTLGQFISFCLPFSLIFTTPSISFH